MKKMRKTRGRPRSRRRFEKLLLFCFACVVLTSVLFLSLSDVGISRELTSIRRSARLKGGPELLILGSVNAGTSALFSALEDIRQSPQPNHSTLGQTTETQPIYVRPMNRVTELFYWNECIPNHWRVALRGIDTLDTYGRLTIAESQQLIEDKSRLLDDAFWLPRHNHGVMSVSRPKAKENMAVKPWTPQKMQAHCTWQMFSLRWYVSANQRLANDKMYATHSDSDKQQRGNNVNGKNESKTSGSDDRVRNIVRMEKTPDYAFLPHVAFLLTRPNEVRTRITIVKSGSKSANGSGIFVGSGQLHSETVSFSVTRLIYLMRNPAQRLLSMANNFFTTDEMKGLSKVTESIYEFVAQNVLDTTETQVIQNQCQVDMDAFEKALGTGDKLSAANAGDVLAIIWKRDLITQMQFIYMRVFAEENESGTVNVVSDSKRRNLSLRTMCYYYTLLPFMRSLFGDRWTSHLRALNTRTPLIGSNEIEDIQVSKQLMDDAFDSLKLVQSEWLWEDSEHALSVINCWVRTGQNTCDLKVAATSTAKKNKAKPLNWKWAKRASRLDAFSEKRRERLTTLFKACNKKLHTLLQLLPKLVLGNFSWICCGIREEAGQCLRRPATNY